MLEYGLMRLCASSIDNRRLFQVRKTHSILRLDSAGRQAEITLFNDILQRNSAVVQYLTLWGLEMASNLISRPVMSNATMRVRDTLNELIRHSSPTEFSFRKPLLTIRVRTMMKNMNRETSMNTIIPMDILPIQYDNSPN